MHSRGSAVSLLSRLLVDVIVWLRLFFAHVRHPWDKCKGIEYLRLLHVESEKLQKRYAEVVPAQQQKKFCSDVSFVHGDALVEEWQDADVVFMNCVCFEESLMQDLAGRVCIGVCLFVCLCLSVSECV